MKQNQTKLVLDGIPHKAQSLTEHKPKRLINSKQKPKFDLGSFFGMPGHRLKRGVVSGLSSFAVFVAIALLTLMSVPTRALASTITQTNWAGGVGTSVDSNQYTWADNATPTSSQVGVGTNAQDAWCNNAQCDSTWTKRKAFYTYNLAGNSHKVFTNYTKRLTVTYEAGMKTDFSDLRFTNDAGVNLEYFINRMTPGVSAEIWLNLPVLGAFYTSSYMYFGNSGAPSVSNYDSIQHDNFENDDIAAFNTSCQSQTVENGSLTIPNICGVGWGAGEGDHSESRVTEFDYKPDLSSVICGSNGGNSNTGAANYLTTGISDDNSQYSNVSFRWIDNSNCGVDTEYFIAAMDGPNGTTPRYFNSTDGSIHFKSSQFYRFRQINHFDGGVDFYYSADDGLTYTQVLSFTPNDSTDLHEHFFIQADQYPVSIRNVRKYNNAGSHSNDEVYTHFGITESYGGHLAYLSSGIIDLNGGLYSSALTLSTNGTGVAGFRIRSSNDSADLEATSNSSFIDCDVLQSGAAITSSNCVTQGDRYYQYQLLISDTSAQGFAVTGVSLNYLIDNSAPSAPSIVVMRKGSGGVIVSEGGWFNSGASSIGNGFPNGAYPVISWGAGEDVGGSGVAGYCLYVGTDQNANLAQTKGLIQENSTINTGGRCSFASTDVTADIGALTNNANFDEHTIYYFKVSTIDAAGNLSASTQSSFKVDKTPPQANTAPFAPNGIINTKDFTVQFGGAVFDDDGGSGLVGWKYCISELDVNNGGSDCATPQVHEWYGEGHAGTGEIDGNGATPFTQSLLQGFTTSPADYPRILSDGINAVTFVAIDQAGNFAPFNQVVVRTSTVPASTPQSLQASPTSAQENAFSFSWAPPQTYQGPLSDINYCYTINEPIASDAHNCTWTGKNITQLAAGPYATKQGVNTLYLMARDQTLNFSADNAASVTFSATTIAPGAPSNLDVTDVSVRSSSSWKLAMSWAPPSQAGSGIASYKLFRSTDNATFAEVGSTSQSNLSFIDTGLSQVTYYYQVKACDNAGNCSIPSNTVSRKPTGRFTSPANLVLAAEGKPVVTDISTRKVTIQWQTDRESDSKIAIGTKSGQYAPDETGSSNQVTSHTVNINNLQPGTEYFYVAKWTDGDGNTGSSPEGSFMTAPAPSVGEVEAQRILVDSATISFRTLNTTSVKLNYGKTQSFGAVEKLNTSFESSDYSIPLSSLDDNTKYYYRFTLTDKDGNEYEGNINSFTTTARPKITNVRREGIEGEPSSTQRFTWDTNTPTSSGLIYNAQGEQQLEIIDSKLTLTHSLIVTALKDTTNYSYVLRSRDAAGNTVTTDRAEFTTALDTRPPKISDVVVETAIRGTGTEARGQITVAWKTDEPSTSQVAFGQGQSGDYTGRTYEDATLTTEHVVVISDLPTSSVYHVQAISRDAASNQANSDNQSVVLGRAADNIFTIIFEALSKIFGVSVGKQE